ncbi:MULTISPECIES: hypothetical protein [Paenibacillus]|nr:MULTISPECIES: hypothetical protein [Paenibacillus]
MTIERFHIHVSDEILDDLKYRLHQFIGRIKWKMQAGNMVQN